MNILTEKLLKEGHTKDNHPDYVEWSSWHDFEYTQEYLAKSIWETPCGLLKNGIQSYTHESDMGVDYCPENNNPRFGCPYYDEKPCEHRIDTKFMGSNCIYHMTERKYNYDESVEKIHKEWDRIKHAAWLDAIKEYGICVCMSWDRPKRKYIPKYNVIECIQAECTNEICGITKKPRNLKKANIYYDVKTTTQFEQGFIKEDVIKIKKGVKLFKRKKAISDLEIYLKLHKDGPLEKEKGKSEHRRHLFFAKYHGQKYDLEIQNVRIEYRDTRDLRQDLQDIQSGIEVVHESDLIKQAKEIKKANKEKRQESKARKSEKRSITIFRKWLNDEGENGVLGRSAIRELQKRGLPIHENEQISLF